MGHFFRLVLPPVVNHQAGTVPSVKRDARQLRQVPPQNIYEMKYLSLKNPIKSTLLYSFHTANESGCTLCHLADYTSVQARQISNHGEASSVSLSHMDLSLPFSVIHLIPELFSVRLGYQLDISTAPERQCISSTRE